MIGCSEELTNVLIVGGVQRTRFDAYRYFYHESLSEADLSAAVEMKRNYIRVAKGRANRIGHNWEAVAE